MATIKARGNVEKINTKIPGERTSGQLIVFEAAAEDLTPTGYQKEVSHQQTGTLLVDITRKGKQPEQLSIMGKLTVTDYPPNTSDATGRRVFTMRPGTRLGWRDIEKLQGVMPLDDDERETQAVNLTFKPEQNELEFKEGGEQAA